MNALGDHLFDPVVHFTPATDRRQRKEKREQPSFWPSGKKLIDTVATVLKGIRAMAHGNVAGLRAKIDQSLGKAVPLAITFIASQIDDLKEPPEAVGEVIQKASTFVIEKVENLLGPVVDKVKGCWD
jgi:hypothetical protein